MATIPFIAYEISGVKEPIYNSGAANKRYVDIVSGNLLAQIQEAAAGGTLSTAFQPFTASTGVTTFGSNYKISGSTPLAISILGYSTISGNAKKAQASAQTALLDADFGSAGLMTRGAIAGVYTITTDNTSQWNNVLASGNEYSAAYSWFTQSGVKLSHLTSSGVKYTTAYKYINTSGALLANLLASGNEYTSAYKSGQKSKTHAYHAKISSTYLAVNYGWATTTDGVATIAHGLLSLPKSHWVVPSGLIAFGIVTKIDTTNITAQITAAGSRILQWWASV
ncbi:MAG: hypothetical protein IMZ52_02900 [Actinobacteria bacterium]|nr:hypothetical protein [Actinomycetota bacterium]MBE3114894.1 hypothetical protein [Actinomycetota bacterium]